MKLGSLKNFDPSFTLLTEIDQNTEVEGITDQTQYLPRHTIFIKNKVFYGEFLRSEDAVSIGVILEKKYADTLTDEQHLTLKEKAWWVAVVDDVNLGMSYLSRPFFNEKFPAPNDMVDGRQMGSASVHPSAWIAQGVFIGEGVNVGAHVKIHSGVVIMSGAVIGEGCEIFPQTTIYRNVKLGSFVRIHANCSIGSDGFGYNFSKGVHHKVWHMGSVVIGDDVEIGAGTCIDSGTFSPTMIGAGSKIDNQVQIGHNCKLGRGVILCGQAGLAGSVTIGDYSALGGKASVANGVIVGKGVQIAGYAGVTGNISDGAVVGGFPARDIKEWMKGVAYLRKFSLSKAKTDVKESPDAN